MRFCESVCSVPVQRLGHAQLLEMRTGLLQAEAVRVLLRELLLW